MDLLLNFLEASCDLQIENRDLATDDGLQSAVLISLFTDRRRPETRESDSRDPRGYWAGRLDPDDPEQWGSHLWLLEGEPINNTLLQRAEQYCAAALEWMKTDGVAREISVSVTQVAIEDIRIDISIFRPQTDEPHRYSYLWNTQMGVKEIS